VWREVRTETLPDHRRVLVALEQQDAKLAESLLREHLTKRSLVPICR